MYDESQEMITAKVKQVRAANIGLIYCVGETLEQKEAEMGEEIVH